MAEANGADRLRPRNGPALRQFNEQPWIIRLVTHDTTSLYKNNCGGCHGDDLKGAPPTFPSLVDIGKRLSAKSCWASSAKHRPHAAFDYLGRNMNEIVDFLITGKDTGAAPIQKDASWLKYRNEGYILFRDPEGYRPSRLPGARSMPSTSIRARSAGRSPSANIRARGQGIKNTGSDNYGDLSSRERAALHWRYEFRQEIPCVR